jgi:hypothetical protein
MRRRDFVALLGTVTTLPIAWLEAARAQQPDRMRHVGVLMAHAESDPEYQDYLTAFRGNSIVSDRRKAAISKLPLAGERSKTRSQGCTSQQAEECDRGVRGRAGILRMSCLSSSQSAAVPRAELLEIALPSRT